jgi:hypothetical protein
MTHLVQLLLPLSDNAGNAIGKAAFDRVQATLVERFGGMTAYTQAPAKGLWKEDAGSTQPVKDTMVIYEVMTDELDVPWWADYRRALAGAFGQRELVVRAQRIQLL